MFVRVKKVGPRRYAYLVDGVREGKRVRQRTLCYLGPVSKIVSGIPENVRKKIEERFQVNWDKINYEIRRIPLTFEEISRQDGRNLPSLSETVRWAFEVKAICPERKENSRLSPSSLR